MALREILRGLSVTARHLLRRPVTYQYPEKPKPVAPRWHGRHVLNRYEDGLEKCIGCELCAWACPADAIYVQGADNTPEARYSPGERYGIDYQINYLRCIYCGLCIEACPTRALTMSNDYHMSDDHRDKFIFTKEMLLAPLQPGAKPPPHTDEEVKARGINYYGGSAFTPYLLSTDAAGAAEPALERRGYGAASSIGSESEVDRVMTEQESPRDTATVQEAPQEPAD